MNSSDQNPKIPLWVFYTTDVALLLAAWFIADRSARPLSTSAMLAVVACVITGAIVALVPLVLHLERQKNEALDERQRSLEALSQTVSSSAEQISIAAGSLHELAELFHKTLRQAEQLPHRLQEKVAEFQAQLANADAAEKEDLEKEVATLRAAESDQLETVCDKIARTAAELAKVESAARQHLAATAEALNKLTLGTASGIGKAQAAAEQALAQARVEAAKHVGETAGSGIRALESAKAAALTDFEARLAVSGAAVAEKLAHEVQARISTLAGMLDEKIARLENLSHAAPAMAAPPPAPASPVAEPAPAPATVEAAPASEQTPAPAAPVPKRPRKPRREEPAPLIEPAPVPADRIPEVAPVAPTTVDPFAAQRTDEGAVAPTNGASAEPIRSPGPDAATPATAATPPEAPKPATNSRKRSSKPSTAEAEPDLGLGIDEGLPAAGVIERVLSSDGATRLLVTAYIGIGNRLFIRGEGPGLTWEKGVPLQFVSIGKWRWETNDASGPIRFKLLKNDQEECSALGAQTLDPGHQQEVTATF